MTTPLRPLSTGELLDRTFNLYRNNFALFAGISALAAVALVLATAVLLALGVAVPSPGAQIDPRTVMGTLAIYFAVLGLFYLIGASLATGATIYAVSKVHLGKPTGIGESYSKVFPRLGRIINIVLSIIIRMIGVILIMYLAIVLLGVVLGGALAASGGAGRGGAGFIILALVVFVAVVVGYAFAIRIYLRYSLAVQVSLLEDLKAGQALKRSSFLTKGSVGQIFLIYLLMGIIGFTLSFVLQLPTSLLAQTSLVIATVWQLLATFIAYTISFPISTIAISLLYYDQRVRKEAFDLQLMMESIGEGSKSAAIAAPIG